MVLKRGNTSKNSAYLRNIKNAIEHDKSHPRNNGVLMQAHHIISAKGMSLSNLAKKIEKFGYDINELTNLSFIPCTLQGACHLGVQPHRGNHTALVDQDDYDDDLEVRNYHMMVAKRVEDLKLPLAKECPGSDVKKREVVQTKLDKLSKEILGLIQKKPGAAPLTDIAKHFTPGNSVGCGGADSVRLNKGITQCSVERNHLNRQAVGQKTENITYKCDGKYTLIPGK